MRPNKPSKRKPRGGIKILLLGIALCLLLCLAVNGIQPPSGPPQPPYTIALDAGHGGTDLGAMGVASEVELTETTTAILFSLLEQDANYTPVLCRQNGENPSVNQRAKTARRAKAHLVLSIHANAHTEPDVQGFECYPAPPGRTWHEDSFRFAELIAAEMAAAGNPLRGEGGIRYVYYQQNSQKLFCEASDTTVRPESSFGIVEQPNCPAVLAEQCFITNQTNYDAFGSPEGCQTAAACYYRAICAYFGTAPVAQ